MLNRFHLAIPVNDLNKTVKFYVNNLGCSLGRYCDKWCDLNFFGHQVTLHLKPDEVKEISKNQVENCQVPVRHFGIILDMNNWHNLKNKLINKQIDFIVKPQTRFKGTVGEQAIMFFYDPSFNALEFKAFDKDEMIFRAN
jgi:extradiol dioxygenase family protein